MHRIGALVALLLGGQVAFAGGSFHLDACNLGCSGGAGMQISCSVTQIPPNVSLTFEWNQDVDLSTVSFGTIRIVNVANGTTPGGSFTLADPRTVVFTPLGFSVGAAYQVLIPGVDQGDSGPFVTSISGQPNTDRLACTILVGSAPSSVQAECRTTPNSVGPGAVLSWFGSSSLALNDLSISAGGLPPSVLVLPLAASGAAQLPFGNGLLCLQEPLVRLRPLAATTTGTTGFDVDWSLLPSALGVAPGASVRFQVLYRDPAAGAAGFDSSDALVADLVP